ncbi:segregation/condensation protein A [Alkalibacterium pelagium]|jgi:segregation and condensation protein A|uniref:Segregation and condensation protein A n=1 Tax=Alkalibacterium pelagium TaxID=426702 RepID=A0A1H7GC52_9LACT|nr:segregation/condensation protein A [Alkalibacterium pelagium]GEN49840.1 segregation and condensation protein A [Alkalibacterium pelagium]SEK35833.1 condensin subunit ScpA [Alkalibacterium pelagium]
MSEQWKVNLDVFEGPLDLLLHLINKYEIDIYDIPIKDITDQYLNYLHAMQMLQLDIAGDYLVMAATLMSMKSQLLLPRTEEWEEEGELFDVEEDSIEKLQERLLEYRRIKYASSKLVERRDDREQYYSKDHSDLTHYQQSIPLSPNELSLGDLVGAFGDMIRKKQWMEPGPATIDLEEITISDKIEWLENKFAKNRQKISFRQLFTMPTKKEFVVTFLAVLQMIKENRLFIEQKECFGEIYLSAALSQ